MCYVFIYVNNLYNSKRHAKAIKYALVLVNNQLYIRNQSCNYIPYICTMLNNNLCLPNVITVQKSSMYKKMRPRKKNSTSSNM